MNLFKGVSAIVLSLSAASALAAPLYLTTHNRTDVESNAYIAGTIPSPYPTAAHSDREVYWNLVRLACYGHSSNGKCSASIIMGTNTNNPVNIGTVTMDLETGEITPASFSNHGYTLTVNGPGEATVTKD